MAGTNSPYGYSYEAVLPSQTAQVLGGTGATGDYVARLLCSVSTAATGSVTLIDGVTSLSVLVGAAGLPIQTHVLELGLRSTTGSWKITTGAGVTVLAIGIFSA